MEFSIKLHTIKPRWFIVYIEGSQAMISKDNNNEPVHEISNNVVCATSKSSDQPVRTHSLIRAFARRLNIL